VADERLQDALLQRASTAIEAAERTVADSEVLVSVSTALREQGMATRCAWCGRYRIGDRWVVVRERALFGSLGTSHGICPDCIGTLREAGMSV
jgi:hypothetical protein